VAVLSVTVGAAPEPDPVAKRWQLDLEVGPLRVTNVQTDEGLMPYFYLTYKVTNNAGEDLLFAPAWDLANDEGEIIRSGQGVPHDVTRALIARHANPLLESQLDILGRLLQGRENAREGIVIWPANYLDVNELNIYAAGFSGEFDMYLVDQPDGTSKRYVLRKTYCLRYALDGEYDPQANQQLRLREPPRWIMR
jgi:hypothetical protein